MDDIMNVANTSVPQNDKVRLIPQGVVAIVLAGLSYIFMRLPYFYVDILERDDFTGVWCISAIKGKGTASLTGWMVIILIIVNVGIVVNGIIMIVGTTRAEIIKKLFTLEVLVNLVVTIIPVFHLKHLIKDFVDSPLADAGLCPAVFLNIGVTVVMLIFFCAGVSGKLSNVKSDSPVQNAVEENVQ